MLLSPLPLPRNSSRVQHWLLSLADVAAAVARQQPVCSIGCRRRLLSQAAVAVAVPRQLPRQQLSAALAAVAAAIARQQPMLHPSGRRSCCRKYAAVVAPQHWLPSGSPAIRQQPMLRLPSQNPVLGLGRSLGVWQDFARAAAALRRQHSLLPQGRALRKQSNPLSSEAELRTISMKKEHADGSHWHYFQCFRMSKIH
jgi:hypothetical protein